MNAEQIERAAAAAWPAQEVVEREGWLLRSTPGLDRARSNAALPLAERPDPAVVLDFHRARGATPVVQVAPLEVRQALDAELVAAGWHEHQRVDVLTAAPGDVPSATAPVAILASPSPRWVDAWARAEERFDAQAHLDLVFRRLDRAAYALAPGEASVGLAVLGDGGACGLFCMATRREARRLGLAAEVLRALAEWASGEGAKTLYLQALATNAPAQALYRRDGFTRSHGYVHRSWGGR